ncbi:hypothetical protein CCYA_CCYA08G2420 [Cyanidiococcus yangmingshanensis]|nr:hypothetical protein CCYA_CCYA08G2420 [Cyanidiococcus yangmingshanensis]
MATDSEWRGPRSPRTVFFVLVAVVVVTRALQIYDERNEEAYRRFRVARQEEALRNSPRLTDEEFRRLQEIRPLHPADVYEVRRERWTKFRQRLLKWLPSWSSETPASADKATNTTSRGPMQSSGTTANNSN